MYQRSRTFNVVRYVLLILIVAWAGFPFFFLLSTAFKSPSQLFQNQFVLFSKPTLENFKNLSRGWPNFYRSLRNSFLIAILSSFATILVSFPAGYALSRYRSRFLSGSGLFTLVVRMYPPIVLSVPLYPIFSGLGLNDSHLVLIFLYTTFNISLCVWLMRSHIDAVPYELEEAAQIDGANFLSRLVKIVLPLSIHGIVSTAVFVMIFAWKEYTFAYIFSGIKVQTAPIFINLMLSPAGSGISWGPLFAASFLQVLPILIFVWCVQFYLLEGLHSGGVKG